MTKNNEPSRQLVIGFPHLAEGLLRRSFCRSVGRKTYSYTFSGKIIVWGNISSGNRHITLSSGKYEPNKILISSRRTFLTRSAGVVFWQSVFFSTNGAYW